MNLEVRFWTQRKPGIVRIFSYLELPLVRFNALYVILFSFYYRG